MSAQPMPTTARRLLDAIRQGFGAPLIVLALLAMVVVPLAAPCWTRCSPSTSPSR